MLPRYRYVVISDYHYSMLWFPIEKGALSPLSPRADSYKLRPHYIQPPLGYLLREGTRWL